MSTWLDFARGPLFIASFSLMVLGLGRVVFLQLWDMASLWPRMADRRLPWRRNLLELAAWMIPLRRLSRVKPGIGALSFVFHLGLVAVPVFLASHVALWRSALGFGGPELHRWAADLLTLTVIATGIALLGIRIFHRPARAVSRFSDYARLVLLLLPFITGFIAQHPALLFTRVKTMLLLHILSGELVLVLIPFSKLSHVLLFPFGRISSDFYWRLPADGPRRVAQALHGEEARP